MYHTQAPYYVSKLTGKVANFPIPKLLRHSLLTLFAKIVKINIQEAAAPLQTYPSINAFFTRELNPNCRPIDTNSQCIVSPVDGRILEYGAINKGTLIQAKGLHYTIKRLIPSQLSSHFEKGHFMCIYLSPSDCHRIMAPYSGTVVQTCHVPGALYPVREPHISHTDNLYTKNERLISILDTPVGKIAVVMVGAINVGEITVSYDAQFNTNRKHHTQVKTINHFTPKYLEKGDHLGTFHLGSTVVLCFENPRIQLNTFSQHSPIKYGVPIGTI